MNRVRVIAIPVAAALVLGAILLLATGTDPPAAYGAIVSGAFGPDGIGDTLAYAIPVAGLATALAIPLRAGVFNISLEGTLLVGCFGAVAGSWYTGSAWIGVLVAVLAATAYSLILAIGSVTFNGDPIVLGVASNLLAVGLTSFLIRTVFGTEGSFSDPELRGLGQAGIPFLGPLSGHSLPVYLSWLTVPALAVLLYRHPWGLRLRGVGERPEAASSLGVDVTRYRYGVILAGGALCGLGGAQLALGSVTLFAENMTAGRGWIAVVAVMLGRAHPLGVFLAALLFGLAEAFGFRLQGIGLPQQATDAAPYVVTLVALFLSNQWRTRSVSVEGGGGGMDGIKRKKGQPA